MRWIDRFGLAVGYALGLVVAATALHAQPVPVRRQWLDWASTNLANARTHPLGALVVSAFVTEGDVQWWVPLSLVALGSVGATFGAWRTAVIVFSAHVLGTLVSEGIVAYRIGTGALPDPYRHILDVGPSYVVVAALVAGVAYAARVGRLLCVVGFAALVPSLFVGRGPLEVSAVGGAFALARRRQIRP